MASPERSDLRADPGDRPARGAKKPTPPPKKTRKGSRGRWWRWGLVFVLWAILLGGGVTAYFALTLPSTGDLAVAERRPSVTLLAADGSLVATFGDLFAE